MSSKVRVLSVHGTEASGLQKSLQEECVTHLKGLFSIADPAHPSLCSHGDLVPLAMANPTGPLCVFIQKYRSLQEEERVSR